MSARSGSPNSVRSGSPSSHFSDLSVPGSNATAATEELLPSHILAVAPPCDSLSSFETYLRLLPISSEASKVQLLLLALEHSEEASGLEINCEKNNDTTGLQADLHSIASALGDQVILNLNHSWTKVNMTSPDDCVTKGKLKQSTLLQMH